MATLFKLEKRLTLVDQVANQLREAITSGRLKSGDRLIEADIAKSMQIGRNAVREAIRYMEKEGLVTTTPFKGAHVTIPNIDEIDQMFEVMSGLEGMCARLAAQKMTNQGLKKIECLHAELENHYAEKDPKAYLKINWQFHEYIQELSKNKVLSEVTSGLRQKTLLYDRRQLYQPNRFNASMQEHRKILAAFRKKDPDLAEQMMKNHLLQQGKALVKSYKSEDGN
ncbi:MAG: hypothetical protein DSY90_00530 [Deltaproteobacteria bacterium]|nr:MAG: hypothetical protein DSY90_00530 [Deltaproteobacteria bacterium]